MQLETQGEKKAKGRSYHTPGPTRRDGPSRTSDNVLFPLYYKRTTPHV